MQDWIKTLATVAPTIATALGSPLAGVAVQMATKALGIENNTTALEVAVLSGGPEILQKMKAEEQGFKLELKRLDIELEGIDAGDRKDARLMAKSDTRPQIVLSALYTIGYFTIMYFFVQGEILISENSATSFNILLGVLTAAQTQIMNFWFGSSHGSKKKDL